MSDSDQSNNTSDSKIESDYVKLDKSNNENLNTSEEIKEGVVKKKEDDIFDLDVTHKSPVEDMSIDKITNKFKSLVLIFKINEKYELVKSDFDILNSDYTKNRCLLCSKDQLSKFSQKKHINLNDMQLVCVMPDDSIEIYKILSQSDVNKLISLLMLLDKLRMNKTPDNMLCKIDYYIDACFYTDVKSEWGEIVNNVDYTYHNLITKNIVPSSFTSDFHNQILKYLDANKSKMNDYPEYGECFNILSTNFNDSTRLLENEYESVFSSDQIELIFDVLYNIKLISYIVKIYCKICISKKLCHFALNEKVLHILDKAVFSRVFENKRSRRYAILIAHFLWYCLYIISREKNILKNSLTDSHRSVLTLEQARCLPDFNTKYLSVSNVGVYLPIVSGKDNLTYHIENYLYSKRSICSYGLFKERLHIFTYDMLKNVDFTKFNGKAALTGSTMLACICKTPMENCFDNFKDYAEFFYPSNNNINNEEIKSHFKKDEEIKIYDSDQYITDIDIAIVSESLDAFDIIAKSIAGQIIGDNDKLKLEKIISISGKKHKWHIVGGKRIVDIYMIPNNLPSIIQNFHIDAVRLWWQGEKLDENNVIIDDGIRILIDCVCALKTGINNNIKWFANSKIPMDTILKYEQRGYTSLLNPRMLQKKREYISINDRWKNLYSNFRKNIPIIRNFVTSDNLRQRIFNSKYGIRYNLKLYEKEIDIKNYNTNTGTFNNSWSCYYKILHNRFKDIKGFKLLNYNYIKQKIVVTRYNKINDIIGSIKYNIN